MRKEPFDSRGPQIRQILAADGWRALFAQRDEETGKISIDAIPVACWALQTDTNGYDEVVGMVHHDYLDSAEDISNFIGYVGPGEDPDDWLCAAAEHYGIDPT